MTTSPTGRAMIEDFEGCRLKAYLDQRGIWTLGYGHTSGIKEGLTCAPEEADLWLSQDLEIAELVVSRLPHLIQNQFDALVSLCFNIGAGNFLSSTVFRAVEAGNMSSAAAAILMWNKTNGKVNPGLQRRREAERELFLANETTRGQTGNG